MFGGYNPLGWISLGEDRSSNGAFLFSFPEGDTKKRAVKLPKVGGPNLAVIDSPIDGLKFGAEGLWIPLKPVPKGQEKISKSRLGTYYQKLPNAGRSLFAAADEKKAQLVSLQVYVAEGEGERWESAGITWKTQVGPSD